ncbi:MAG: PAS domain S-box protein, partial [bacterium]
MSGLDPGSGAAAAPQDARDLWRLGGYGVAVGTVIVATVARLALNPLLEDRFPFATLFFAVLVTAGVSGFGPAVVATLCGGLAATLFLLGPDQHLTLLNRDDLFGLALYLSVSLGIAWVGGVMRRARRAAEAEARDAAARREELRVTLQSIGDAVITTDVHGRITSLNAVAAGLTGWTAETAIGQPLDAVFVIINEDTRQPTPNPATRALAEGRIVGLANHTLLIARDGSERPIDDSAAPIRAADGSVAGCVLVFRDISERHRAERTLRESEARKGAMFESALDCIITIDQDGLILEFNAAAERTFGHRREDVVGRELADMIIPPSFRERYRQGLARYRTTGEGAVINKRVELPALRADGREIPIEMTVTAISVRGTTLFTAYLRDISERTGAAERERLLLTEAADANAKFRAFFEQGALFAGIMSVDGTIVETNRLAIEACGYTREQVVDRPFWECPWWSPSAPLAARIKLAAARAAAGETYRAEMPYYIADGSERLVDLTILPIKNAAGQVQFLAPTGTDITERKQLENELRQLAADLSEANRRKSEFLAMLAHELRNPLAPIRNALQIIKLTGDNPETVHSAAEVMERQVGQMVRLVDDLIDVNRISRGTISLRKAPIDVATVVHQAVETVRSACEVGKIDLIVNLPAQPLLVGGEQTRLAQVVGNLLHNACKFTESGGRIDLSAEQSGAAALLRVRDTGIGIAAEQLSRIFEMFTQGDRSLERSKEGLGIGLALVKQLVEMHGGSVEAHSSGIGRGSEFVVRLPLLAEP